MLYYFEKDQYYECKRCRYKFNDFTGTYIGEFKIVDSIIADGTYDNKNFQYLSFRGIKPAIKVRKNSIYKK